MPSNSNLPEGIRRLAAEESLGQAMPMAEGDPEVKANLAVWGRFEPLEVGELLGVVGSIRRHTDLRTDGKPFPHPHDSWVFKTQPELTVDWPAHVEQVLSLVRPVKAEFIEYCQRHELEGQIGLVATISEHTPIGTLSRDVIREIAELGFSVDIDLYVGREFGPLLAARHGSP